MYSDKLVLVRCGVVRFPVENEEAVLGDEALDNLQHAPKKQPLSLVTQEH